MQFGKRTHKPNSVYAVIPLDAALPRTFISDLPGGFGNCWCRLGASGRCAAHAWLLARASLPIWSCSVWGLPCHRHYCRRGALLPHLFTLTAALDNSKELPTQWRYVFCGTCRPRAPPKQRRPRPGRYPAHCPAEFGLSSPGERASSASPAATARSPCQPLVYRDTNASGFQSSPAACAELRSSAAN